MPLSGIYVKIIDISRRDEYPAIINYQGCYYEAISTTLTATPEKAITQNSYSTLLSSTTAFNTLEAMVVATANEDYRLYARPAGIYAYYDI